MCFALGLHPGIALRLRPYVTVYPSSHPNTDTVFSFWDCINPYTSLLSVDYNICPGSALENTLGLSGDIVKVKSQ